MLRWHGRGEGCGSAKCCPCERRNSGESANGAWGPGPFDNDAATDWYLQLIETSDLWLIEEALHTDGIEHEFFVFPDMGVIEAACEV
jgi:Domain of unknown function (DUF4259)